MVTECELYKKGRDVLEGEMRDVNEGGMESFDALDTREKNMAGDENRPQKAKQDGTKRCKKVKCTVWKKCNEHLDVGGVSIRSKNSAPSRKGCVVNRQTTKVSNKCVRPHHVMQQGQRFHAHVGGTYSYSQGSRVGRVANSDNAG
ncbi:unnamed protein product [Sphacelaria rigidula]